MVNRKNIISVLMALSLVFAVGGYAFAAGFSDTSAIGPRVKSTNGRKMVWPAVIPTALLNLIIK